MFDSWGKVVDKGELVESFFINFKKAICIITHAYPLKKLLLYECDQRAEKLFRF